MRTTHNCREFYQVEDGPKPMPNTRIVGHLVGPITIEPGIYKERIYVTNYLQKRRTNQAPSIYGDEFLQNINILRELRDT